MRASKEEFSNIIQAKKAIDEAVKLIGAIVIGDSVDSKHYDENERECLSKIQTELITLSIAVGAYK